MARVRPVLLVGALALAGLALAGCGRRGALEPPPEAGVVTQAPADPALSAIRRPRRVPITPPDQPFVLDPLL